MSFQEELMEEHDELINRYNHGDPDYFHGYVEKVYRRNPKSYKASKIDAIKSLKDEEKRHIKTHIEYDIRNTLARQIGGFGNAPERLERKYLRGQGRYQAGQDSRGRWYLKDERGRFIKWKK